MDGQISWKNKKPIPDCSVPDKRAKLNAPSNIAEACSNVIPKLNRSSAPGMSPHQTRSVSSADSSLQKSTHVFDFRFVASDNEVRELLVALTGDKHQDVTLISHPDDLSQANLVSRLSISDDGRRTLDSGKLFESLQPLTLVMDIRKLSSEDLPKFNDLLDPDTPCLYDKVSQKKRPLGKHVSLLVVADPEQLASVGQRDDAPGADFWRRINRPENSWQCQDQTGNDPSMDIDEMPPLLDELPPAESAMDDDTTLLIDCHLHNDWRQLLLGGPGVDQQGRIQHLPGRLESLRAGQRVILKGANWQALAFEQTIRQMLVQQCFESNGKVCQLPDEVQFYRMPVGKDELHSLFQSLSQEHAPDNPVIINQSNITEWLNPFAIAPEGYAVPNTCLLEQVRAGGTVTVTSPLTEALWFRLLGSLQTIRETTGLEPRVQLAHSRQQPKALGLAETDELPLYNVRDHLAFNTVTYQQHAQASHWIGHHSKASLVIQVNEQTGFSQLFDNIHITSEQKALFGRRQSELQEALTAGRPVVFRGLESNPTLQQLLEPLVVGQPLLLNGQLEAYPHAHVTILWPESVISPSSVFRSMVAAGSPCPEVDLWGLNGDKHGIPRAELPEQALNELYEAFKTVPDHLCSPLPELTEGLLNNLMLAARRAQQVDHSPQLLPRHWRKAINSLISHGTRQTPSVRDFMKVACWQLFPDKTPDAHKKPDEDQPASVDPDQLNEIINSAPGLDREFVQQNLWSLARAFDPAVFNEKLQLSYENPFPWRDEKEALDRLCALIVDHIPEKNRQAMACQLAVDPQAEEHYQTLALRPSRQIKRLQDALASGWQLSLPSGRTRSDVIKSLATDCFQMTRIANSETEGIERIKHRLSGSLAWQGSTDEPWSALARDLYHGEMSQKDRESRRLSRLHDRLKDAPVIFLQGETGTGKSYFSAKMAKASGSAAVLSLGPSDSEQTLMKCWQWQNHADGDRSMAEQNRALMEWARTSHPKDGGYIEGKYITLVLDEANLAKAGLLASLNGLWEPEPCIYVNGHPVPVSTEHRVILTGNPIHYGGRQLDSALKEKLPRAYYPRLDQAFLRDRVVEPALLNHLQRHLPESQQINDIARIATEGVMVLWQYYQELLPEHEFTPRDLTDICSWVGWYLDRSLSPGDRVNCKQVQGLIQQSFRDVLGSEITETHRDALSALEIWFAARYQPENTLSDRVRNKTLSDIQQTFSTVTQKIRPEFDTSGSAVSELVQQLGQDLSRCQQAYHLDRKHGGRQATLIEGPAGRGKDATLNLVIESVREEARRRGESMPEVFYLNACDCSWDRVCEAIQKAKVEGGIVVISEMNLIDSQHLEGELNDILAGDAHPGFHLFATINPPEYSGRKPLSPALKGRFRHLPIRQYNQTELQTIVGKVLPESLEGTFAAKKLTEKHCLLRAHLQRKKLPLQPTSRDLQNVARAVIRARDFTDNGLNQCFQRHYRLYLMAAGLSLEELPGSSAIAMSNEALDTRLCEWVSGIDRPWLIRHSDCNSMDEKRHEIRIKTDLNREEARTEIIRMLARTRWQASGLSVKPDESDDILTQTLYRHWQRRWFDREYGQLGVDADSVFPLTDAQKQTLKTSTNQPYLEAADQQIRTWKASEVQFWPGFWHQISDLLNHCAHDYTRQDRVIDSDKAPEECTSEVRRKQANALDRGTDYQRQKKRVFDNYKIFDTNYPFTMYRLRAKDINVSAKGEVELTDMGDQHLQGIEILIPEQLPGRNQELTLAKNQTLANYKASSGNGQYALPSLTPEDCIVALRIEPVLPYTLLRDRYTGLHTLSVPEAKAGQIIQFTYVVEPREPSKKTLAKKFQPAQSIRFDARCSKGIEAVLNKLFAEVKQQLPEIKVPLQAIMNAKNTTQRISAIRDYCLKFSGAAEPARHDVNFFHFLVTRRQGSCRHRTPVFIAFCRYFGIPCREIINRVHAFAEYSVDRGQTWKSVDLGGAPAELRKIPSDFQRTNKVSRESKKARDLLLGLLMGADSAQQQTLAKTYGMSLEELNKVIETGGTLPGKNLGICKTVLKLWKGKDLTGFSMGVSMIESLETEALGSFEQQLVGKFISCDWSFWPMSAVVINILSDGDEVRVIEQLQSLHSKMIVEAKARPLEWLGSMVNILEHSDLANPSIIRFALKVLELGWLNPLPRYSDEIIMPLQHHELLMRLKGIEELKVEAANCLKKWYQTVLKRGKKSQSWRSIYEYFLARKGNDMLVSHCHEGASPTLNDKITNPSLDTAWTDDPEGVPNIERMLVNQPAFVQLHSVRARHRPLIILGHPFWSSTLIDKKARDLLQLKAKKNPDLKLLLEKVKQDDVVSNRGYMIGIYNRYRPIPESGDVLHKDAEFASDLENKCKQAILQAFCHYLYELTHSKGGRLTYCWGDAPVRFESNRDYYGAHDPSSPEELYAMFSEIDRSEWFEKSVDDTYLRQTLGDNNALVLRSAELIKITEEFLNSVNLNSLCESLNTC
ncbi:AAA family ATPase [Endozoicomonas sp. 8E]|uniref:AAA family ATPase n=1 Tax=Endozoicomonas sp. 8E TaxID=3035692 RepID=UPI0029393B2F|nr:AAA family ATPase [Endozoicomonas sp. 8E]WOG28897.1 AAA family ATPase [Endozoicomonas sp. 8E]